MLICFHIVYGCFHATASELSSSDRVVAYKTEILFSGTLQNFTAP